MVMEFHYVYTVMVPVVPAGGCRRRERARSALGIHSRHPGTPVFAFAPKAIWPAARVVELAIAVPGS